MDQDEAGIERLLETLIDREGGFVDHPHDRGGATCFGVTEAVARAHGYRGAMRHFPRAEALAIYRRLYWLRPRFDEVAARAPRIAAELFDTGVNMGPAVAVPFSSARSPRSTATARTSPIWFPTGASAAARWPRSTPLSIRGQSSGETVLLKALEALQGERYLRLAERRPANESFLYGWLANRSGTR